MNFFIVKQLPVLSPERYSALDFDFILPRVVELTYNSIGLQSWARALGYEGDPFGFDPDRRMLLRAELDAYYAKLYGLTRRDLQYILDPQSISPGYPSETFSVLQRSELREFGEYRTQKLVLDAWDKLEKGELV